MEETAVADEDGEAASDKPEEAEEEGEQDKEENDKATEVEDEEDDQPKLPSGLTGTEHTDVGLLQICRFVLDLHDFAVQGWVRVSPTVNPKREDASLWSADLGPQANRACL